MDSNENRKMSFVPGAILPWAAVISSANSDTLTAFFAICTPLISFKLIDSGGSLLASSPLFRQTIP